VVFDATTGEVTIDGPTTGTGRRAHARVSPSTIPRRHIWGEVRPVKMTPEQVAAADLELQRIRQARAMMFEWAWRRRKADYRSRTAGNQNRPVPEQNLEKSEFLDPVRALPEGAEEEERRFVNAVNDPLPDLINTSRYEKRAVRWRPSNPQARLN
jgi:hypothetical protein